MYSMKSGFLFLIVGAMLAVTQSYGQCNVSGPTVACGGSTASYTATGLSGTVTFSVSPINAGSISQSGNTLTITFNNPATSPAFVTVTANGSSGSCSRNTNVFAPPGVGTISGPSIVNPTIGYVNSLPVVTYTLSSAPPLGTTLTWATPAGWDIISGQGTTTLQVQPSNSSACSGTITATVKGSYPSLCTSTASFPVSRGALSEGEISNYITSQTTWPPLDICPDDDLFVDASSSTFCGPNNNVFVAFIISDPSWAVVTEYNRWLTPTDVDAIGGLSHLDIRLFLSTYFPSVTIQPNRQYKVKIAVGGTSNWNERTYYVQVNSTTAPQVLAPGCMVLNPGGSQPKNVVCIWQGDINKTYQILYQYKDGTVFTGTGVTTNHTGCINPQTYPVGTGYVSTTLTGLPDDYFFRYKVRECPCGVWTLWTPPMQMLKEGSTGINVVSDNEVEFSAYPNPFANGINVDFTLQSASEATIAISDMLGRNVKTVAATLYHAGSNSVNIHTENFAPGLYTITIRTDAGTRTMKVLCNK
jgi:hypothetical protein